MSNYDEAQAWAKKAAMHAESASLQSNPENSHTVLAVARTYAAVSQAYSALVGQESVTKHQVDGIMYAASVAKFTHRGGPVEDPEATLRKLADAMTEGDYFADYQR